MAPDSGSMVFDGEGVDEFRGIALKDFRRNLQMVFQDSFASLNPRLTVAQTIAFGPQVHGMGAQEANQLARDLLAGLTVRGAGWSAWYNLGLAQLRLGDLPAAAQAFTVAAQRCPTCEPAVKNRDVLAKMGVGP